MKAKNQSDDRTVALKNQVRKAQDLIRQFEDGTGRHNSNLAAAGRDAGARINLDASAFDEAHARFLRTIGLLPPGWIMPSRADLDNWYQRMVKPQDELEFYLVQEKLLRANPQDCQIGQIVRIETIDRPGNWAQVRGAYEHEIRDETGWGAGVLMNSFEFERTRYQHQGIVREFWKRVA